jgi:hypothetical protein
MSARTRPICLVLVIGLALALASCGGGGSVTTISGRAPASGGLITYRGQGYTLAVPTWKPYVVQSPEGRVSTAWSTPGTGDFAILVTADPHPGVSLDSAANASLSGSLNSYHPTAHSVLTAHVTSASGAKLITTSGPRGVGYYRAIPQKDANLIVTTPSGAMINVLVVSHGSGNPDPLAVIDSFRLTG